MKKLFYQQRTWQEKEETTFVGNIPSCLLRSTLPLEAVQAVISRRGQ
jgi:hypothetical protein